MNKILKKILVSFGVLSLLVMGGCSNKEEPVQEEVIELVPNDVYAAPKNPTNEQKKVYNKLSEDLKANAGEDVIAVDVALNFIYDFFTLYNKESKDDVGGLNYIPEAMNENFKTFAVSYLYENFDTIMSMYDKESLPYVISHELGEVTAGNINYNGLVYDGFTVNATVQYKESKIDAKTLKTSFKVQVFSDNGIYFVKAVE